MAYELKYTIPFVDVSDNAFEVRISQEGYTGEAMVLDGAPSPFVSRLDDSDDLMTPIRTSTAQISFVDDIDITAITPRHALEYTVELYSLADDEEILKWRGFLRPDIYTQPNIAGPNIISVNAASSIEVLKGFDMDILDGNGIMPVYKILQRAARQVWFTNAIHFPAVWYNRLSIETTFYGFAYPLALRISTMIYISENENALDGENPYSASPYTAFLEDFCKLFGLTLVDDGLDWYFVKSGWAGDYIKIHSDFLTDSRITDYVTESITVLSTRALHIDDDSGTVDVYNGRKSVAIDIATDNDSFRLPNIEDYVITDSFNIESFKWTGDIIIDTSIERFNIRRLLSTCKSLSLKVKILKYKFEIFDSTDEPFSGEFVEDNTSDISEFQYCGAQYIKWDTYNENVDVDENKKSWSPINCILINDAALIKRATNTLGTNGLQLALSGDKAMVKISGQLGNVNSGAFLFNCSAMATSNDYFHRCAWLTSANHYSVINDNKEYNDKAPSPRSAWQNEDKYITASLRVGKKYFNGDEWLESERPLKFKIPFEKYDKRNSARQWYSIQSNKTIDMPYEGESGYYIPIDKPLFGEVEFCIYHSFIKTGGAADNNDWRIEYMLRGLSLKYVQNIDITTSSDKYILTKFEKSLATNAPDDLKLDLDMHGEVYAGSGISRLFSEKGNPVRVILSKLYPQKSVQIEQQLLDTLAAMYEKPSRRYTLGIDYREIKPFDIYLPDVKLRPYALTGYEVDWAEHHADVKLSQVAKFAPITAIMEDTANETQG